MSTSGRWSLWLVTFVPSAFASWGMATDWRQIGARLADVTFLGADHRTYVAGELAAPDAQALALNAQLRHTERGLCGVRPAFRLGLPRASQDYPAIFLSEGFRLALTYEQQLRLADRLFEEVVLASTQRTPWTVPQAARRTPLPDCWNLAPGLGITATSSGGGVTTYRDASGEFLFSAEPEPSLPAIRIRVRLPFPVEVVGLVGTRHIVHALDLTVLDSVAGAHRLLRIQAPELPVQGRPGFAPASGELEPLRRTRVPFHREWDEAESRRVMAASGRAAAHQERERRLAEEQWMAMRDTTLTPEQREGRRALARWKARHELVETVAQKLSFLSFYPMHPLIVVFVAALVGCTAGLAWGSLPFVLYTVLVAATLGARYEGRKLAGRIAARTAELGVRDRPRSEDLPALAPWNPNEDGEYQKVLEALQLPALRDAYLLALEKTRLRPLEEAITRQRNAPAKPTPGPKPVTEALDLLVEAEEVLLPRYRLLLAGLLKSPALTPTTRIQIATLVSGRLSPWRRTSGIPADELAALVVDALAIAVNAGPVSGGRLLDDCPHQLVASPSFTVRETDPDADAT